MTRKFVLAALLIAASGVVSGCVVHEPRPASSGAYGDRDRDGVANRYDRDRDGDRVPNQYDRAPNNPRAY